MVANDAKLSVFRYQHPELLAKIAEEVTRTALEQCRRKAVYGVLYYR